MAKTKSNIKVETREDSCYIAVNYEYDADTLKSSLIDRLQEEGTILDDPVTTPSELSFDDECAIKTTYDIERDEPSIYKIEIKITKIGTLRNKVYIDTDSK